MIRIGFGCWDRIIQGKLAHTCHVKLFRFFCRKRCLYLGRWLNANLTIRNCDMAYCVIYFMTSLILTSLKSLQCHTNEQDHFHEGQSFHAFFSYIFFLNYKKRLLLRCIHHFQADNENCKMKNSCSQRDRCCRVVFPPIVEFPPGKTTI